MKNLVATLRTTTLKMARRKRVFGEAKKWRFFAKNPKIARFPNSEELFDSNFLLDQKYIEFYDNIKFLVIARPYSSFSLLSHTRCCVGLKNPIYRI